MKKTKIAPLSLALALIVAGTAAAEAGWVRSGTATGPNGRTVGTSGQGSCANGACNSQQNYTGPNGGTATRSGSSSCSGGVCNSSGTVSGPNGGSVTRSRSVTRY
ncbi:MAG: hypothetical protein WC829_03645 [Hyphomicrobium sp.]